MLKRLIGLFVALALVAPAQAANTTLGNLSAGAAVSATDLFYDVQTVGLGGVKVTGTQLKTFFSASPTFTGTVTTPLTSGGTQCVQVNASGVLAGTGTPCGGSGSTPGGVNTNVQFNGAGSFAGDVGFTYTAQGQVGIALGTITSNLSALTITGTFNNAATTFDAPLFMNVTNTASATPSFLMDLQVASATKFNVDVAGNIQGNSLSMGAGQSATIYHPGGSNIAFESTVGGSFLVQFDFNHGVMLTDTQGFTWTTGPQSAADDVALYRDGSANVAVINQPSKTTAVGLRVYNTTDTAGGAPTNYERVAIDFTTSANVATIGTQKGGTGSARNVALTTTRHISMVGGTPTANTCAGFALATGSSDATGTVTYTSATTCSITWGSAYTNAPFCQVTPGTAAATVLAVASTSGLAVTFGTAQTAFAYHCFGT